jgi:hypothetical protein
MDGPKRGFIPPFGKGRGGGILQNNVVIIMSFSGSPVRISRNFSHLRVPP